MLRAGAPTVRRERDVPDPIRAIRPPSDYVDVFTVTTKGSGEKSAEEWARAGVEQAAGLAGQFVWRVVLGLRLAVLPSPDHIGGWKIAERGSDWLRLEAKSWFLTAHLLVHVGVEEVSVATFVRYDRALARFAWPRLAVGHRRAMPGLLRRAARLMAADS